MDNPRKRAFVIRIGLLILFVSITISNLSTIRHSINSLNKLRDAEVNLNKIEEETVTIMDKIQFAQTDEYLEQEALKRFNLVKEPSVIIEFEESMPNTLPEVHFEIKETREKENMPNKRQWMEFFKL